MKKKGRVSGTIGWILGVALVGGTVAYSAMFDSAAVGKMKSPIGASVGSVVGFLGDKSESVGEAKKFVEASGNLITATAKVNGYSSYTLNFTNYASGNISSDQASVIAGGMSKGALYVNEKYAYLRVDDFMYSSEMQMLPEVTIPETEMTSSIEYFFDKADAKCYTRQSSAMVGVDSLDKDVAWEDSEAIEFIGAVSESIPLEAVSGLLQNDSKIAFDYLSGMFKGTFKDPNDGTTSNLYFKLGMFPTFSYTQSGTASEGGAKAKAALSCELSYSAINQTKIDLPKGLKKSN